MRVISFNNEATSAIHGRKGGKLRIEVRDGTLFMRPTDRKAGPHVLAELKGSKSKGVNVEITDKHLEKLGASEILADTAAFGLKVDKYGWYAMTAADAEGNVEGASATVSIKEEPATAEA